MDDLIQHYVTSLRENGSIINTAIVISGAKGLLKSMMLAEYGDPVTLSKGWAKSLLKCMNFTKRIGTTQAKVTPEHFKQFLQYIVNVVKMENISPLRWCSIGTKQHLSGQWPL